MEPNQATSTSRSRTRQTGSTTKNTIKNLSTYDTAFQQKLVDSHIYYPHYEYPGGTKTPKPDNWDYINERLARSRASLSPSRFTREQHDDFVRKDANAAKEDMVKKRVIPIIEGTIKEGTIKDIGTQSGNIPFTNLAPLVATNKLVNGNPDIYYGARPEQLDLRVREELEQFIIPSTQHDLPILPNHFTAAKGPDGTAAVARRQATYDSCFGARAQLYTRSYGQVELQFDNNAYTVSTIYNDGMLKIYTNHLTPPNITGQPPNYYMTLVRCFAMDDSPEVWRDGAKYYRNSIDMAEEFRNEAIKAANEVVDARGQVPAPALAPITPLPSNTDNNTAALTNNFASASDSDDDADEEEEEEDNNDADEEDDEEYDEEEEEPAPKPFTAKQATRSRRRTLEEEAE